MKNNLEFDIDSLYENDKETINIDYIIKQNKQHRFEIYDYLKEKRYKFNTVQVNEKENCGYAKFKGLDPMTYKSMYSLLYLIVTVFAIWRITMWGNFIIWGFLAVISFGYAFPSLLYIVKKFIHKETCKEIIVLRQFVNEKFFYKAEWDVLKNSFVSEEYKGMPSKEYRETLGKMVAKKDRVIYRIDPPKNVTPYYEYSILFLVEDKIYSTFLRDTNMENLSFNTLKNRIMICYAGKLNQFRFKVETID